MMTDAERLHLVDRTGRGMDVLDRLWARGQAAGWPTALRDEYERLFAAWVGLLEQLATADDEWRASRGLSPFRSAAYYEREGLVA